MNQGLKIAYLAEGIRKEANRAQYQRARYLGEKNQLYLLVKRNAEIPPEIEERARVVRSRFDSRGFWYLFHTVWLIYRVLKLHRRIHLDLVYSFYDPFSIIQGFILKLSGCKWVLDIWDHPNLPLRTTRIKGYRFFFRSYIPLKIGTYIAQRMLKYADLIILALLPEALPEYGVNQGKIFPVTNGVDLNITQPKGIAKKDDVFRVFYVGYVRQDRGIDTLLSAMGILKEKLPSLKLTLVGDTAEEDRYHAAQVVESLNLEKYVDFLGVLNHDQVLHLEECSDVCIFPFPSVRELDYIHPIKMLEYLAMGRAVVATDLKGVRTIINDGENGLLVEPDNPEDMARAILRIYESPELRKRIEGNARRSVEKYSWNKINEQIDAKLKEFVRV